MRNRLVKIKTFSTVVILILMLLSCNNIVLPTPKNLITKENLINEVNEFIQQNQDYYSDQYAIYPNVTQNYLNGEKTEIHYVEFYCYNENLNDLENSKIDSLSKILSKTILSNIENDTSFSSIVVTMIKQEKSGFAEHEWSYSKEFKIDEFKK